MYSEHVINSITPIGNGLYHVDAAGWVLEFYFPDGNEEDTIENFILGRFDDEIMYEMARAKENSA